MSLDRLYSLIPELDIDSARKYFRRLDKSLQSRSLGRRLYYELFVLPQLLTLNHILPDFSQPDTNGKVRSIREYRGRYVLIDFWASWCAPCLKEIPEVKRLYNEYHSKGFEIVGIALDHDRQDWVDAVKKYQLEWPTLSDLNGGENTVAQLFGIKRIPTKLLIDPSGRLVLKNPTTGELQTYLQKNIQ